MKCGDREESRMIPRVLIPMMERKELPLSKRNIHWSLVKNGKTNFTILLQEERNFSINWAQLCRNKKHQAFLNVGVF